MHLPLRLLLDAPPPRVFPMLARALQETGLAWKVQIDSHAVTWSPPTSALPFLALSLRLEPDGIGYRSRLSVDRLTLEPPEAHLLTLVQRVVGALRRNDVGITPVVSTSPPEERRALLVAPRDGAYRVLLPLLEAFLGEHRLRLHYIAAGEQEPGAISRLSEEVQAADMVLGEWSSLLARTALYQAWIVGKLAVALQGDPSPPPEWPGSVIHYGQRRTTFLSALEMAVRTLARPSAHQAMEGGLREEERQRIYRQVALDGRAPLSQRLHAARVLAESGDPGNAAEVLGRIVASGSEEELVSEALTLLGGLGKAAYTVLWQLDARTLRPELAVEIARQLARASDKQTALFRLERLAQHERETVRLAALSAMAGVGSGAAPRFEVLARGARDPKVRLAAARWLLENGGREEAVRETLVALASRIRTPDIARAAVETLAQMGGTAVHDALVNIATHSPSVEARLAASEAIMRQGDTGTARAVLLTLAEGEDDAAAGAALKMLAHRSDTPTRDTERLMTTAALRSVRRRAAEMLSQPHQPESAQFAAARVFISLDRPALARPVLLRLVRSAESLKTRRWAAQQLAALGETALEEIRTAFESADDPVVGQYLAEGLLAHSTLPDDRRKAAIWLAEHSNLPRAVEVLGDLALSARVSGSDAVQATDDLNRYASHWAGAARTLAILATDSAHSAVRTRALDLLLREHPSEIPLSLLVDLAITGSIGTADRFPVMQQVSALAEPVAARLASRIVSEDVDTDHRWRLLDLMGELPDRAAMPALIRLTTSARQNRIRYVAAEQLIARGQEKAGYAALASIAINDPDWVLRERAVFELAQGLPETLELLHSIVDHTRYENTFHLAREILQANEPSALLRVNRLSDTLALLWDRWVASLPLGWVDRLVERLNR